MTIGVPIITGLPRLYQQCTNCQKQSTAKMTIGVPIITGLPRLYQQCTNRQKQSKDSQNSKNHRCCTNRHRSTKTVPTVYQSSKTVNSKNNHWCTNRHRSTKTIPTVYQSSETVKRQSKQQKSLSLYQLSRLHRVCRIHKVRVRHLHPLNTQSPAIWRRNMPHQSCRNIMRTVNKFLLV